MTEYDFSAISPVDTDRLGAALADVLPESCVVGLSGTLGAGKTRLVQAVAVACGIPAHDVVSPTFVLCQAYHGRRQLFHFDAYRLRDAAEFRELGPDECFEAPAVTFVEWSDRVADYLPEDRLEIAIAIEADERRAFTVRGFGCHASVPDAIRRRMLENGRA